MEARDDGEQEGDHRSSYAGHKHLQHGQHAPFAHLRPVVLQGEPPDEVRPIVALDGVQQHRDGHDAPCGDQHGSRVDGDGYVSTLCPGAVQLVEHADVARLVLASEQRELHHCDHQLQLQAYTHASTPLPIRGHTFYATYGAGGHMFAIYFTLFVTHTTQTCSKNNLGECNLGDDNVERSIEVGLALSFQIQRESLVIPISLHEIWNKWNLTKASI